MSKEEQAKHLFKSGANCAQSVIAAFSEECHISHTMALQLGSSFGAGMGRLREVCGAVSGIFIVIGLRYGYNDLNNKQKKDEHYALVQKLAKEFRQEAGSIICRELLGLESLQVDSPISEERTEKYYKKRPCIEMVGLAAKILDKYLSEHP